MATEESRSLTRSTLHSIAWITVTRGLKAPLNLIAVAVLARILTPTEFGIVALAMVIASFSDTLIDGSFGMVLIQQHKITPDVIGATFVLSTILAGAFSAAMMIFSSSIEHQFQFPHLREVLLFLAAMLPITAITTVTGSLLQRSLNFRTLTLIGLFSQLVYIVSAISLALGGMGLWSLVWAQMLQWAVEAVFEVIAVRKQYQMKFTASAIRDVLHSGGMFTVSKLLRWAANSVDRVVVGRFLGAAELGFYSRANTLLTTARQLAGAGPMRVLFASFSKMQHDVARMRKAYNRSLSLSLIASMLVSAFIIVNAELIVRVLLGPRWLSTIPLIQILFLGFAPKCAALVAESVPLAFGLGRRSAAREAIQLCLVALGAFIGSQFGVVGATIGICAAYWLFYFACLLLVQQLLHPELGDTLRIHANSLVVALIPLALSGVTLWLLPRELLFQFVPPIVFGFAALAILAFGPAALVSDDVVRGRSHFWSKLQPRIPHFGHGI